MPKEKKEFYFSKWGYTRKDFQKWGRKGGSVFKYASNAERQRAYRRRKMQAKIAAGLVEGVLNLETGRVRKFRNGASRQRGWRERRKLTKYFNWSVLHSAASVIVEGRENWEIIEWLIKKGADATIKSTMGSSVYDVLREKDQTYAEHYKALISKLLIPSKCRTKKPN